MSACAALARAVDDAAHHRDLQLGHAGTLGAPLGHARVRWRSIVWASSWKTVLVVRPQPGQARHLGAEARAGPGSAAAPAAHPHLRVRSPPGSGVSETRMVSPMPSCSRTARAAVVDDDAFAAHARLGEPQVQRVVAARGQVAVHRDRSCTPADLAREHDAVRAAGRAPRPPRRVQGRADHRLAQHRVGAQRLGAAPRSRPSAREQLRVEDAPVDADAHRLAVAMAASIMVANCSSGCAPCPTLPGLMRYLARASAQSGNSAQQLVAVVVEVADQRHVEAVRVEALADRGHLRRRAAVLTVMRTSSEPAAASSSTWRPCAAASAVSVLVIDCTTTGAPPPTSTPPTRAGAGASRRGVGHALDRH